MSTAQQNQQIATKRPISERSVFILQELLKLRRMSRAQFAKLCCIFGTGRVTRSPISRLSRKGLVRVEYMPLGMRSEPLLKLTEAGHRQAAVSMGRDHVATYHDYVNVEFLAHLLMANDLYLRIVADDALDWASVRENASRFDWHASNDDTSFLWDAPAEFRGERKQRRVVPDITVETDTTRYLIEIERSTKTLGVVGRKIENYCHLFSPLKSAHNKTGYAQKYLDTKRPIVVFVLSDPRRAAHVRELFDKRAKAPAFHIPEWRCGTVGDVGAQLRKELLAKATVATGEELLARYGDVIRRYVFESTTELRAVEELIKKNEPVRMPKRPASLKEIGELVQALQARGVIRGPS